MSNFSKDTTLDPALLFGSQTENQAIIKMLAKPSCLDENPGYNIKPWQGYNLLSEKTFSQARFPDFWPFGNQSVLGVQKILLLYFLLIYQYPIFICIH